MRIKFIILSILFFFSILNSNAQTITLHDSTNTTIALKVAVNDTLGFSLWWKCDSLYVGELFTTYFNNTGLSSLDTMKIDRQWTDSFICLSHLRYQQYYKGLPVEYATYKIHFDPVDSSVIYSNGRLVEELELSNTPVIAELIALDSALAYLGIETDSLFWNDDSIEYYKSIDSSSTSTTYFPEGDLLYALTDIHNLDADNYRLAWKFRIIAHPNINVFVYVDAETGHVIKELAGSMSGDFTHQYYGTNLYLDTRWAGGLRQKHYVYANDNGKTILTKDKKYYGKWGLSFLDSDSDDSWGTDHWGSTEAHYVVHESYEMFRVIYGLNGMDGNRREIRVHGNDPDQIDNAGYIPDDGYDRLMFGSWSASGNHLAALDIAGHEFTHGVDNHANNLVYAGESGAIDEAIADNSVLNKYTTGIFKL